MTDLEKAARQALEALEESHPEAYRHAITALRQALEQPAQKEPDYKALWQQMCERCDELDAKLAAQQEPVAFLAPNYDGGHEKLEIASEKDFGAFPVYTRPQAREPLTGEELAKVLGFGEHTTTSTRITLTNIARAIEAAYGITGEKK